METELPENAKCKEGCGGLQIVNMQARIDFCHLCGRYIAYREWLKKAR